MIKSNKISKPQFESILPDQTKNFGPKTRIEWFQQYIELVYKADREPTRDGTEIEEQNYLENEKKITQKLLMGVQLNRNLRFDNKRFQRNKHRIEPHLNNYRLHILLYTVMQFLSSLRDLVWAKQQQKTKNSSKNRRNYVKWKKTAIVKKLLSMNGCCPNSSVPEEINIYGKDSCQKKK